MSARAGRPAHENLKPADISEPRFFDELKNSQFLKDLYTEKVSL